jgi:hypothetical protein
MKFFKSFLLMTTLLLNVYGFELDFSDMPKLSNQAHIQDYKPGRIKISNNVLSISMSPLDGDGNTGNNRWKGNRQRNELSIIHGECVAKKYETVKYDAYIYIPPNLNWYVPMTAWYHIFQIKKWGVNRPVITVGVKGNKIVLYRCESYNYIIIGDLNKYKNKWIKIDFEVIVKSNVVVNYKILGQNGSVKCEKYVDKYSNYIYIKLGQYRYFPNPIKNDIIVNYKNVKCFKA